MNSTDQNSATDGTDSTTTTRRQFMRLAGAGVAATVVGSTPAAAESSQALQGKFTTPVVRLSSTFGFKSHPDVPTYGADANPGFFVQYETDQFAELDTWVQASGDWQLLKHWPDRDLALVAAPPSQVGVTAFGRRLNRGLAGLGYVESVDVNMVGRIDPLTDLRTREKFRRMADARYAAGRGDLSGRGLAFDEDAETATTGDIRQAIGVDDVNVDGAGVTVAILDTGANVLNGQIFGDGTEGSSLRIIEGQNMYTGAFVRPEHTDPDWSKIEDGNGHGSHVAATAVGAGAGDSAYQGIAPGADVAIGKTLHDDGSGEMQYIVDAVQWATDEIEADVIIMSLGSVMYSKTLADQIGDVLEPDRDGHTVSAVTVAAGNSRHAGVGLGSPADTDGVVAVGATNLGDGTAEDVQSAYFSQVGYDDGYRDMSGGATRGENVDVSAPGMKVEAMVGTTDGFTQTRTLSGTSMANPVVGGVAALVLDADPGLVGDPEAVRTRLRETAKPAPKLAVTETGAGWVSAVNAATDERPTESQADAMNPTAESRDTGHAALSGQGTVLLKRALGF